MTTKVITFRGSVHPVAKILATPMISGWAPKIEKGHEGEESWGLNWRGDGTYPLYNGRGMGMGRTPFPEIF